MNVRGLIGVVHVPALPGDPRAGEGGFAAARARALVDIEALAKGGVDALLLENFGSVPFSKREIPPHQVATLALLAHGARAHGLPVGVNCLRNDARAAIGIAAACELDFVRVNVHTGACVTDQGIIEGEADCTLRYRQQLGAERVAILADVMVKHAVPLGEQTIEAATRDCVERGLADGLIVTGSATGAPIDPDHLERVRSACGDHPLFLGSGVTPDTAARLAPFADGAIVGTWLKRDGVVAGPVDVERVKRLADVLRGLFGGPEG